MGSAGLHSRKFAVDFETLSGLLQNVIDTEYQKHFALCIAHAKELLWSEFDPVSEEIAQQQTSIFVKNFVRHEF